VVPSKNAEPDAGVHVNDTGGFPSVMTGAGKVTGWDGPVIVTETAALQAICGGGPGGSSGSSGVLCPQALKKLTHRISSAAVRKRGESFRKIPR
jgi:hypothetical protein